MFDPAGRYLDEPLLGFPLGHEAAEQGRPPTRLPDGGLSMHSDVLHLDLRAWRGGDHPTLRFFDPATGSYLLSAEEQVAATESQQQESEQTIAALRARIADLEAQRGLDRREPESPRRPAKPRHGRRL